MSLLAGLTYSKPLCAIVGLSGYMPLRNQLSTLQKKENLTTPVWLGHGTADPVVDIKVGKVREALIRYSSGHAVWENDSRDLAQSGHGIVLQ